MKMQSRLGPLGSAIKKELYVELRYPLNFLAGLSFIFIIGSWFILSAFAFSNPNTVQHATNNIGAYAIWGLVIFLFMSNLMWSVANFVRREQMNGTLEQLYLSSSSPQIVLLGGAIGQIIIGFIGNIIIVIGFSFFMNIPAHNFLLGFWVLMITLLMFLGLSLIFGAIILRMKRAQMVLNLIQFVFMFLCGIFFPFDILPESIQFISKLIPVSYAVDLFRNTLVGSSPELITNQFLGNIGLNNVITGYWFEFLLVHVIAIFSCIVGWFLYAHQQDKIRNNEGLSNY